MGKQRFNRVPAGGSTEPKMPVINDAARKDGGNLTDDKSVPAEQIEKIEHNAVDHNADEPGS